MAGRRIDDHSFWAGSGSGGSVLPLGSKMKQESSASSVGAVSEYEDTTEKIKSYQDKGSAKVRSHGRKPGERN